MGKFRDQMEEEMLLRGFGFQTRKAYKIAMRGFVVFCGKAPDQVGCAELRAYLLALIAKGRAAATVNAYSAAVRFFYEHVLRKPIDGKLLPYCKVPIKLPEVLAPSEVAQILDVSAENLKHWTILSTSYGTGLRLAEVRVLRIADIDSKRMTLRVQHGKGGRDRYVMLPKGLLELLRKYYRLYHLRPEDWLFPGNIPGQPLSTTTFQRVFQKARRTAGITKSVSLHSLRHAFATHLLESGTNLLVIQRLLGHKRLTTTQVYLHLAQDAAEKTISPLDRLPPVRKAPLKRRKAPKVKPSH